MDASGSVEERSDRDRTDTRAPAAKPMTILRQDSDQTTTTPANAMGVKAIINPPTTPSGVAAQPAVMDVDIEIVKSPDSVGSRAPSTFSMDDLEVAKALTGMREASPASSNATLLPKPLGSSHTRHQSSSRGSSPSEPEPLLSLLVSQHPLVATAINGSLSAYTSSKSYSSHFRVGAEFVERNIASPMASTVGTAGRLSGVETGVRWWLQRNDSSGAAEAGTTGQTIDTRRTSTSSIGGPTSGSKRRRTSEMEVDGVRYDAPPSAQRSRADSEISLPETLPAYDDQRSPVYEESPMIENQDSPKQSQKEQQQQRSSSSAVQSSTPLPQNWQTRLMMSTSGLGVAMSEESLRSLKYCFSWLRWANSHLARLLVSLQNVLQEWERSQRQDLSDTDTDADTDLLMETSSIMTGTTTATTISRTSRRVTGPPRDQAAITRHLQALKGECIQTLKNALDVVSKYAGGALPENARWLVRRHLTSLPQRFQAANTSSPVSLSSSRMPNTDEERQDAPPTPEAVTGARRVVVLAREGLDMMSQVSAVVNGTIVSAEEWCERLGKRRSSHQQVTLPQQPPLQHDEKSEGQQQQQQQQQQQKQERAANEPVFQGERTPKGLDIKMATSP